MDSNEPPSDMNQPDRALKRFAKRSLRRHLGRVYRRVMRLAVGDGAKTKRIHELRTESRRSDAALVLFADFVPPELAKAMRRKLSRLRSVAGDVRDKDVQRVVLSQLEQRLPLEFRDWLKGRMHRSRARKLKALVRHCRRMKEHHFDDEIAKLIHSIDWPNGDHDAIRSKFLGDSIEKVGNPLLYSLNQLKQNEQQFHQVRILGRRLRYTIDLMEDRLSGTSADRIGDVLSEMQSMLGDTHDQSALLDFIQTGAGKYSRANDSLAWLLESLKLENAASLQSRVRRSLERAEQLPKLLQELTRECHNSTRPQEAAP